MRTAKLSIVLLCLGAWLGIGSAGASAAAPAWQLNVIPMPSNFEPGTEAELLVVATNMGGAPTKGPITFTDTLPAGLTPVSVGVRNDDPASPDPTCDPPAGQTITCTSAGPLGPARHLEVKIFVEVSPTATELTNKALISGGDAPDVEAQTEIPLTSTSLPFGFLPGFFAPFTDDEGNTTTLAGSHPYQLTLDFGFPTELEDEVLGGVQRPKRVVLDLPRGALANPAATPVLCTEAELITEGFPGCPDPSQIGTITITTFAGAAEADSAVPLYNMVPPPGQPANVGFNALGIGIFIHATGEVRSEGDFGLSAVTEDILALPRNPIFGSRVELWGDPSSPTRNELRGGAIPQGKTAFLTLPGDCSGAQLKTTAKARSWEAPSAPFTEAHYQGPVLDGCNEVQLENPSIEAKPTSNVADSPSGLDFKLHLDQRTELGPEGKARASASLKDATLTLPEGLVVNPSAAVGQDVCTPAQIDLKTKVGVTPPSFFKTPVACPDASKLGTLEATTPLLAQYDESKTKVLTDPEGNPIPRPVKGAIYLAKPFQNPFNNLLAVYLVIDDPLSGTVVKLAARVSADPITGQLRNILTESPELPIEDVHIKLFAGARASLRTPLVCTTYSSTADLVPWSAPQAPSVQQTDSFAITGSPDGGPCPATPAGAPHRPGFVAGTVSPTAGAYSPFVLKVSREDGSQPIEGFEATLPPGLSAKLAGVPYCPEAQIAQARSRSHPEEGAIEQANPSCPAASEVGSVDVAAGAGPVQVHTSGRVYLAGPYKGAPLSLLIITPAVAGPFDLGTVTTRAAAYLNPETAIVRTVSDPLPTILEGIPLDLRSATVRIGRPQFTLNPTSCNPKQVSANATSAFGQTAALSSPFQVGGCGALAFKPKFNLRLKGQTKRTGHPKLIISGSFKAGQANLKRAAIALPRSEFLDQAHIGTVCTRVQFAAKQCPERSVYGFAKATTPLLDKPLEGPVYLRSSNNELPDVVLALSGQVEVVLGSRIDSVNGGIRATAENVPDAPVTNFKIEMRGGRKGLLINSVNLCAKPSYATVKLDAQNGKTHDFKALMQNDCKKKPRKGGKKGKGKGR